MAEAMRLGIQSSPQWSHLLVWATFGFLILLLLFPVGYAFISQLEELEVPYHEHLRRTYRSFFDEDWLVVSSLAVSLILGVFFQHLLAEVSNLIWKVQKRKFRRQEILKEDQKRILQTLSGGTGPEIDNLDALSTGDFRLLFSGMEGAIAPDSYSAFYIWHREEKKDLAIQELRFFYDLFEGIKGLMALMAIMSILFLPVFSVAGILRAQVPCLTSILTFVFAAVMFAGIFKVTDLKLQHYRSAHSGAQKVLFKRWLLRDKRNSKLFIRELRNKMDVLGLKEDRRVRLPSQSGHTY
ncbi:MAG: hypothetical protein KAW84_06210 [Thermoplasmata archaeon]|nr:hypothetical protein [Thermoplasmata archaeon]